jgi:flagellar basal body rod protein FlgC
MSGILNISVSGLNDAKARVANAASNIVNAVSTNFRPKDVVTTSQSTGDHNLGVTSSLKDRPEGEGVDLASELVTSKIAQNNYGANAVVIKIAKRLEKALLDIKT